MHGPKAALCSGPDEDSAHVAVVCAKEIKEQSKRGAPGIRTLDPSDGY